MDRPVGFRGRMVTLTHARLRLAQGDVRGARRLLGELAGCEPAAGELLDQLPGGDDVESGRSAPDEEPLPPPQAGDPRLLGERLRAELRGSVAAGPVARLERWLSRITDSERS